jgi:hypothetical protein
VQLPIHLALAVPQGTPDTAAVVVRPATRSGGKRKSPAEGRGDENIPPSAAAPPPKLAKLDKYSSGMKTATSGPHDKLEALRIEAKQAEDDDPERCLTSCAEAIEVIPSHHCHMNHALVLLSGYARFFTSRLPAELLT